MLASGDVSGGNPGAPGSVFRKDFGGTKGGPSGNQTWQAGKSQEIEVSIGKSPTNGVFSIAMFDYFRVCSWVHYH